MWWLLAIEALAADIRSGETVVVDADEVVTDDLYAFGREIRIEGRVEGDVVAAAERVEITGTVTQDLTAAARVVQIDGAIEDDARIAGQTLALRRGAWIGDEVMAAGFGMQLEDTARVGDDVTFGGYELLVDGDVGGDVDMGGVAARIRGHVAGDVNARLDYSDEPMPDMAMGPMDLPILQPGLIVEPDGQIDGVLELRAPEPAVVDGAVAGNVVHRDEPYAEPEPGPQLGLRGLRRFLGLLLVGLALIGIAPHWTFRVGDELAARPVRAMGAGLVALVGVGVAAFVILLGTVLAAALLGVATLGGLSGVAVLTGLLAEGALATVATILVGWVAAVPVLLWTGRAAWERWAERVPGLGWVLLSMLVPYVLLTMIPVVGWLLGALVTLVGVGGIAVIAGRDTGLLKPTSP